VWHCVDVVLTDVPLVREGAPNEQDRHFHIRKKKKEKSGHEPQSGLNTKTDRLTDRQSQCDFDLDFGV
jgi:hypothetical protein